MAPSHSRPWPSGQQLQEHRHPLSRPPCQPSPKYSLIPKGLTCTRPPFTTNTSKPKPQRSIRVSLSALPWRLSLLSACRHHPARRRCQKRSSRLASFRDLHSRLNTSSTQQRNHNQCSTTSNNSVLPGQESINIMAGKRAARRMSKPPSTAAKKSRKGRPTAFAIEDSLVASIEPKYGSNTIPATGDTAVADASITEVSSMLEPRTIEPDASASQPPSAQVETTSADDQLISTNDRSISVVPSTRKPVTLKALTQGLPNCQAVPSQPSQKDTKQSPVNGLPTPAPSSSPRPITPEEQVQKPDESSSELSSAPTSIGSTPEGLIGRQTRRSVRAARVCSPTRRSERTRKRSVKASEADEFQPASKRHKAAKQLDIDILPAIEESPEQYNTIRISTPDEGSQTSANKPSPVLSRKRKSSPTNDVNDDNPLAISQTKRPRLEGDANTAQATESSSSRSKKLKNQIKPIKRQQSKIEKARERSFYTELAKELAPSNPKDRRLWPKFSRSRVIMYGSDAQTQYTPAYATEPARRGGKNNGRGAARGGRGGAGNGKGRNSKGRGRGRDDDSPEPPLPKKTQSQEDAVIIKHVKARQAELRKFFATIGNQQTDILGAISARELNRLARKSKAHKTVPEYEEIIEQLNDRQGSSRDLAFKEYELAVEAENERFEAEKAAVENTCKTKVTDIHQEYRKGAQGDLIIFRRAIAAAHDETRTQDGSEVGYLPHYPEFPEPDQTVRGYTSTRITDEKPFKHHLLTFDDQARREVIDDDVGPVVQAFAQKNAERRAEEERKKTQTMEALSEEAEKQLKEIKGYLIPRPMWREEEVNTYALSSLANVAEWMAHRYPNQQYIYMPLEHGATFPREALNYDRLPGRGVKVPPPPPKQSEIPTSIRQNVLEKPLAASTAQPTRRSLRNLQPNGPVSQSQSQPTTSVNLTRMLPTSAVATSSGPGPGPGPHKLAPAPSFNQSQPRPSPIDTRSNIPTPPERSPAQTPQNQPHMQLGHVLPPLQPRHISQSSLPPPPPHYGYPPQYSPTHPPPYPSLPQQGAPSPYTTGPAPSPYAHQQHPLPPSPYGQHPPPPYHHYGPSPYYPHPHSSQQQYSFMPPQQGLAPSQASPASHSQPGAHSTTGLPPPLPQYRDPYRTTTPNGYLQNRTRSNSNLFKPQNLSLPQPQSTPQPPPQHPPPPPHQTSHTRSRARAKAKQPVMFVNQTLATRKAAAEQLAKEEAAAAAEKKDKDRQVKDNNNNKDKDESKGRKLAPKV